MKPCRVSASSNLSVKGAIYISKGLFLSLLVVGLLWAGENRETDRTEERSHAVVAYSPVLQNGKDVLVINLEEVGPSPYFFSCCLHEPDAYLCFRRMLIGLKEETVAPLRDTRTLDGEWARSVAGPVIFETYYPFGDETNKRALLDAQSKTTETLCLQHLPSNARLLELWNQREDAPKAEGLYLDYTIEMIRIYY